MIAVAGIWELVWNTPIAEVHLWEMVCRSFGVDRLYMAPRSGISSSFDPLLELESVESILDGLGEAQAVFVDDQAKQELRDFWHPVEPCCYLFGRTSLSSWSRCKRRGDLSVRIEDPAQTGVLWGHQAAAIVLRDRQVKAWPLP